MVMPVVGSVHCINSGHYPTLRLRAVRSRPASASCYEAELEVIDLSTATVRRIYEKLRWNRKGESRRTPRRRITTFIRHSGDHLADEATLSPSVKSLSPSKLTWTGFLERRV